MCVSHATPCFTVVFCDHTAHIVLILNADNNNNRGCDMVKDNDSAKTPKQAKSNSGQCDEKPTYSPDKMRQWLKENATDQVADKPLTRKQRIYEIKDEIAAVYPAGMSAHKLVKGLNDNGLDITLKTFRTYWQEILKKEKEAKAKAAISDVANASTSEPETAGKNESVFKEKPASVSGPVSENSEGENQAGNALENVQDQEPEPAKIEPEKCDFCFGEMAEISGEDGWKVCKSCGSKARKIDGKVEHKPACPSCKKPMQKRTGANGDFWGCTGYPACRASRVALD